MRLFTGLLLVLFLLPAAHAAETDIMKMRALEKSGITTVKVLLTHPMETGTRIDKITGELIPAHYLTRIDATWNGVSVFRGVLSAAISKNPYLAFKFEGGAVGDVIEISWEDNLGHSDTQSDVIR